MRDGAHDPAEVATWAATLRETAAGFTAFLAPLEPLFLTTGERLRDLHGTVAALSEKAEAAGALLCSTEFDAMLADLAVVAGRIDHLRERRGGLVEGLAGMVATTKAMLTALAALNRIMSHIRVLAVNAKIESAQLTQAGIDFSVFTREIARLAHSGDDTIEAVRVELNGLGRAAGRALELRRAFEDKGLPELDAVAGRLAGSIQGMRDRQGRAAQGVREIPERLRSLFANIADLVSDLQIHDITRQRLDHIERALVATAHAVDSGTAGRLARPLVGGVAGLQADHLAHAGENHRRSVADVGRSLSAMAEGAPAVGALCERTFGAGGGSSPLDIEGDLEKASAVFAEFAASREQAESSLGQVVQAAARAGELMRSLNSVNGDMRLMGLNASIKCGNMGEAGRSLNVIAQELQAYAHQTRAHVETVAGNLGQITGAAGEIGLSKDAARDGGTVGLKDDLDRAAERLRGTGTRVAGLLDEIGHLGGFVVEASRAASQGFTGRASCDEPVARGVRALKALATASDSGLAGPEREALWREALAFAESKGVAPDLLTGADFAGAGSGGRPGAEAGGGDISDLLF